jgi:hypothetical protein
MYGGQAAVFAWNIDAGRERGENMAEKRINVAQMGLGPIGLQATRYLAKRPGLRIVGAVDVDPAKAGQDVGTLAGIPALGVKVTASMEQALAGGKADAVLLTTVSSLAKAREQLKTLLPYGVNVVSSCEELSYPWVTDPQAAAEIDALAKKHGVSVLATGVNPGFLMDFLPAAMSGVCRSVSRITVERIQDATFRRVPFQKKIGAGLTVREFEEKAKAGVLRHVGLTESIQMIAARLGWQLDETRDELTPIIAAQRVETEGMTVEAGRAAGVQQIGVGIAGGREVIRLVFRAAIGESGVRDRIVIEGSPGIDTCIAGGLNGDVATCAILTNAIPVVVNAKPGLRTMVDIEPITWSGGF